MRLVDDRPLLSASDLANFLDCGHLTSLDHLVARGELKRPYFPDPDREMLERRGREHEQRYLETLRARFPGGAVVEIAMPGRDTNGWQAAAEATRAAMAEGAPIIYQGTFCDGGWIGRADFLVRVETPSDLGPWSYEVVDTKLSTVTKARAIIQLCVYSELLARVQGRLPAQMRIVLGRDAGEEVHRVDDYLAYVRTLRHQLLGHVGEASAASYPDPVEHCGFCDFRTVCDEQWRRDDHLSLVASISRRQRQRLVEAGVRTLSELGALPLPVAPPVKIDGIGKPALLRIREQARLQAQGRLERRMVHELIRPVVPECGLASLPPPSPGDLYFDLEGEPFAIDGGLEYLFGLQKAPLAGGEAPYHARWAFTLAEEKRQFEWLMDFVMARLERHPDMHVYHYAPYEPTALKRLMGRHGTREAEVDRLLRGGVLVDLYRAVRQGVRASVESYSIKKLEPLYGFKRVVPLQTAISSRQSIAMCLGTGAGVEGATLQEVEGYNRDDCLSAMQLHRWLEQQRGELERLGGEVIPRPKVRTQELSEDRAKQDAEVEALKARLLAEVPEDPTVRTADQQARWLMAQMLEWHRRENKSVWWDFYHHTAMTDDELLDDRDAIGGLEYRGVIGKIARSNIHRYQYPPQEHAIVAGTKLRDVHTEGDPGEVVGVDEQAHTIDLKRAVNSKVPHPRAVFPWKFFDPKELRASLRRIAAFTADHGLRTVGPFSAACELLLRARPRLRRRAAEDSAPLARADEEAVAAACRLASDLDHSVLPVQGPPGSGKTYTGSQLIVRLLTLGKRVGITANSHKVICNLLKPTVSAARKAGIIVKAVQKVSDEEEICSADGVTAVFENGEVLAAIEAGEANIVAGTAWLWAREEMIGKVDVLVVDEAGQFALANALAVAPAAGSLVLLGDPQQLNQPTKGVHPEGVAGSALEHLLAGAQTISPAQGLFLPETRRLHPDVCRFTSETFYAGKLRPLAGLERQTVTAPGALTGTGLRYVPVPHAGNQSESPEEVDVIARLYAELVSGGATWTDAEGKIHDVTPEDVLVVAPYNAQVAALKERLGAEARVGTVDKFQGQEAPVVICSMTTSSAEEAPRGMEFLYSPNRLNVATSRARCLAVLVASPELLRPVCRSPRQIRLANAFCRFMELAQVVTVSDPRDSLAACTPTAP